MTDTTTNLTIRTATPADLAAVDALLARSYPVLLRPDYPPSVFVTAVPLISRAQPALLASGTYFLAERDGAVLGAGGWTPGGPPGAANGCGIGHIRHVVTDHRATRQGIGSALMRHVMADAKTAEVSLLHCQSTRTAVPFYAAMGLVAQYETQVTLRPGILFPAIFMVAAL